MHTVEHCFDLGSDIINLEVLEDKYVAVTTKGGDARINSCENYDNTLFVQSDKLSKNASCITFSPNTIFLAFALDDIIYVIDTRKNETINQIKMKVSDVELLKFDPSSEYLIVATKFGRVFQYKSNNSSVLARLCSFPYDRSNLPKHFTNYVSSVAFINSLIACSGYGGAIFVMDFHINTYRDVITHSKSRTDALCFIDEKTLIAGNNDGDIIVISMHGCIEYETANTPFKNIKHIIHIPNTHYVFLSMQENYLVIFDYESKNVVNECYAKFHDNIVNLALLDEKTVIVGLQNSEVLKLNLPTPDDLDEIIKSYSLAKILSITQHSTILQNYKNYQKLEKEYDEIYKKAVKALIANRRKTAVLLLRDFKDIKSKRDGIRELFKSFEYYEKLKLLVHDRRFADAYALCTKLPLLMETPEYKAIENKWQENYLQAQKELLHGRLKSAQKLLILYKDIPSKKELCSFIFVHYKEFVVFLKGVAKKDFITIDAISEKHDEFMHIPLYKNLKTKIEGTIKLVENCLLRSNIKLASTHLEKLKNIPHIKPVMRELELKKYKIVELQEAYERKDFQACYRLLDTKKFLHHIALGKVLEKHWTKLIKECEAYALEGMVEKIKETLGELINIESRKSKLGDLLRVGYHTRIKKYLDTNNSTFAMHIIETYLSIFGIDHEIVDIIKIYEDRFGEHISYENSGYKRGHRDDWRISIKDI